MYNFTIETLVNKLNEAIINDSALANNSTRVHLFKQNIEANKTEVHVCTTKTDCDTNDRKDIVIDIAYICCSSAVKRIALNTDCFYSCDSNEEAKRTIFIQRHSKKTSVNFYAVQAFDIEDELIDLMLNYIKHELLTLDERKTQEKVYNKTCFELENKLLKKLYENKQLLTTKKQKDTDYQYLLAYHQYKEEQKKNKKK